MSIVNIVWSLVRTLLRWGGECARRFLRYLHLITHRNYPQQDQRWAEFHMSDMRVCRWNVIFHKHCIGGGWWRQIIESNFILRAKYELSSKEWPSIFQIILQFPVWPINEHIWSLDISFSQEMKPIFPSRQFYLILFICLFNYFLWWMGWPSIYR